MTPSTNDFSPISTTPEHMLIQIFEHLPQPSFVSGLECARNRSAILGVSHHWQEVGSRVLCKSLVLGDLDRGKRNDSWEKGKVDSWVAYAKKRREMDPVLLPPLVVNLQVRSLSSQSTRRVLGSVRGVKNLTLWKVSVGPEGVQLPVEGKRGTEDYEHFLETNLKEVRSISVADILQGESNSNTHWWKSPPLEIFRHHGMCYLHRGSNNEVLWNWINLPTLNEISVSRGSLWSLQLARFQTLSIETLTITRVVLGDSGHMTRDALKLPRELPVVLRKSEAFSKLKKLVIEIEEDGISFESLKKECHNRGVEFNVEFIGYPFACDKPSS